MDLPSKLNAAYLIIQASGSEIADEILDSEDTHVWYSLKYLSIGWLNDSISLAFALQITALIIFVLGLIFLILQWNKKDV